MTGGATRPEVTVVDLGSTNGTLVDGQPRRPRPSSRDGSTVRIGNTDIVRRGSTREEG